MSSHATKNVLEHDVKDGTQSRETMTRRGFFETSAKVGGGLLLSCTLRISLDASAADAGVSAQAAAAAANVKELNAWVRITTDDIVTVIVSQAEMGQGISTSLPAVLVDELGADWTRVRFENAPVSTRYRNPARQWQFTGNSESTAAFFDLMHQMGAAAREMLTQAAAERWQVDAGSCHAEKGRIVHAASGRSLSFGELAEAAATKTPPKTPTLKPKQEWQLIGKSLPRVDNPSKLDGTAVFGVDVVVPNMAYAAVKHAPTFGGEVASVEKTAIAGMPGIIDVVTLPNAVVVVAERYWQARRALDRLPVRFKDGPQLEISNASLLAAYHKALSGSDWHEALVKGTMRATDASFASHHTAEYESQFLAHATMEPMNATATVTADGCDIIAPTQGQELAAIMLSKTLNLPQEKIRVTRTFLGGGFGRRLYPDFIVEAALASKAVNRPVKLIWSREEDMQHDIYRPAVLHRLSAGLDRQGRVQSIDHKLVSPSILQYVYSPAVTDRFDPSCCEGLLETHYAIPHWRLDFKLLKIGLPTSVLRTTGFGPNIFALECFIDELAQRARRDPVTYRRALLANSPRALAVLDLVAEKARWSTPPAAGRHRGVAFCEAFNTIIAQVVELSVVNRIVRVHRVVTALDPGELLDPDISTNSIEGGVAWGLSAALKSEVTFEHGRAVQSNFHDYEVLRLHEMPETETHFIRSGARPIGGVGEVGPVTVVPALVNAVSRAIGRRLRSVPLTRHGLHAS